MWYLPLNACQLFQTLGDSFRLAKKCLDPSTHAVTEHPGALSAIQYPWLWKYDQHTFLTRNISGGYLNRNWRFRLLRSIVSISITASKSASTNDSDKVIQARFENLELFRVGRLLRDGLVS